jgi:hypothetical protein
MTINESVTCVTKASRVTSTRLDRQFGRSKSATHMNNDVADDVSLNRRVVSEADVDDKMSVDRQVSDDDAENFPNEVHPVEKSKN